MHRPHDESFVPSTEGVGRYYLTTRGVMRLGKRRRMCSIACRGGQSLPFRRSDFWQQF